MAFSASFVRPDRVMSTGVISPYPIRTESPVTVARGEIAPFVNMVRTSGPTLGGSDVDARRLRAAAARVTQQVPSMSRMGTRPLVMRDGRPSVASRAAQTVARRTEAALPGYLDYLTRAARSGYRVRQAGTTGSIWDITRAKQHQLRALWRPGWRF